MTRNQANRLADYIADMVRDRPRVKEHGFAIRIRNIEGGAESYYLMLTVGPFLHAIPDRETWEDICTTV